MENWKRRSARLLTSLIFGGREDISVVPYYPQKTVVCGTEQLYFGRAIPEKRGISSRRLYHMLCELEEERRANVHSITVFCRGDVICECTAPGYDRKTWHIAHSMSKTVCGMVIGCLCDRGIVDLNMRVADIFPEIRYRDRRFSLITVEHLLSMTSGVEFREPGVVTESDWTEAYFNSYVRFIPGTRFDYNSMNSYILARIAERLTGRGFGELADALIFAPLGIKNYLWEIGPEGSEKGGWGLYMSPESWLKLGVMLLRGGKLGEWRILSEEWVKRCSSAKAITPKETGSFNYSYHIWVGRSGDELLFSGMLGQSVWICPKNDIVVVMTGGNDELFAASPALEIVRKYLGAEIDDRRSYRDAKMLGDKQSAFFSRRRWAYPLERRRGILSLVGLTSRTPFDNRWSALLGKYTAATNNLSMLPLMLSVMQNNLGGSISEIAFTREGEELLLKYRESAERFSIPIGLYGYRESVISVRGEPYIVRAIGECQDSPQSREYRIELIFPETASTRRIEIAKDGSRGLSIKLSESPGEQILQDYLAEFSKSNGAVSLIIDLLERRFGSGIVAKTIKKTFTPNLIAVNSSLHSHKKLLEEENRRIAAEGGRVRFIQAVVDRFFGEGG